MSLLKHMYADPSEPLLFEYTTYLCRWILSFNFSLLVLPGSCALIFKAFLRTYEISEKYQYGVVCI